MEQGLDKNILINQFLQISHGKIEYYDSLLIQSAIDPALFGHFVAWNNIHGKVTDNKVLFPVIALRGLNKGMTEMAENAIGHMMYLGPRELVKAYQLSKEITAKGITIPGGFRKMLQANLQKYLQVRESNQAWFDKAVMSNRKAMIELYAVSHKKPSARAQAILFDKNYPDDSIFAKIKSLRNLPSKQAAAVIMNNKIPFQIAIGSVAKVDNEIIFAIIENMTGNELINSTKMLERYGLKEVPELRAAYEAALKRAQGDKRVNVLKASKAAEVLDDDLAEKILTVQKAQEKRLSGIEGDWLVLGDRSSSMSNAIELARKIASSISSQVKGKIYLVFFNDSPMFFDVSGKNYNQVVEATKNVSSNGCTSIGCGLDYIHKKDVIVNGIAIVSDGEENTDPRFKDVYINYSRKLNIEPTVYYFAVGSSDIRFVLDCKQLPHFERYNMAETDEYSLPNIVSMMKTNRYSLLEQIEQTELLTLERVWKKYEFIKH